MKGPVNYYFFLNLTKKKYSPYFGGIFTFKIILSDNYPFEPPEVVFETAIKHLNIYPGDQRVCLTDIQKGKWSSSMRIDDGKNK